MQKAQFDLVDAANISQALQQQFSFKKSSRLEQQINPHSRFVVMPKRHSYRSLIVQRTILDSAIAENNLNGGIAGRMNQKAAQKAQKMFEKFLSRHWRLWNKICWNQIAWQDKTRVNFDQQDLMILARRIAKIICYRQMELSTRELRRIQGPRPNGKFSNVNCE